MNYKFKSILSAFCLAGLLACAKSEDSVTMTINTGIPVRAPSAVNLSNNLMSLMSVTIGQDCYQDQVYLVVHDPNTKQMIATKKVKMRAVYNPVITPAITYGNDALSVGTVITRLGNSVYFDEPLTIQVPTNRPIEIGFIGTFFNPIDAYLAATGDITGGSDGICDQNAGSFAISSSQMMGHTLVDSNALKTGSINLNIDVMHTNPSTPYSLSANPVRYRDWIEFDNQFVYSGYNGRLKSISFLEGKIKISLDNNSATKYYLPRIFPYVLDFTYSAVSTGCLAGTTCSGDYRALVNNNIGTTVGGITSSTTISPHLRTDSSTLPGVTYSTFPTAPTFTVTTYGN